MFIVLGHSARDGVLVWEMGQGTQWCVAAPKGCVGVCKAGETRATRQNGPPTSFNNGDRRECTRPRRAIWSWASDYKGWRLGLRVESAVRGRSNLLRVTPPELRVTINRCRWSTAFEVRPVTVDLGQSHLPTMRLCMYVLGKNYLSSPRPRQSNHSVHIISSASPSQLCWLALRPACSVGS